MQKKKNSYADGKAVGIGLKPTPTASRRRRLDAVALPLAQWATPTVMFTPTAVVGLFILRKTGPMARQATPTAPTFCRRRIKRP